MNLQNSNSDDKYEFYNSLSENITFSGYLINQPIVITAGEKLMVSTSDATVSGQMFSIKFETNLLPTLSINIDVSSDQATLSLPNESNWILETKNNNNLYDFNFKNGNYVVGITPTVLIESTLTEGGGIAMVGTISTRS